MSLFTLKSPFTPAGDQQKAIDALCSRRPGLSTLMGVTGSGKTYTVAQVISRQEKPVLVLSPNKTLAAQLYEEFSLFFPDNKVCYFVSYYDYYQPESYLPAQDMYIPKETKINSEIERLRNETTASIVNRRDTIVIASVSCIYSLGNPMDYREMAFPLTVGESITRRDLIRQLISIQYVRNEVDRASGTFQVRGSTIEVQLPYQRDTLRIELFGYQVERIQWLSRHDNTVLNDLDNTLIFPAKHFVTTRERADAAIHSIKAECDEYLPQIANPLYADRLKTRVAHDLELLDEVGVCPGIENYSIHFDGRKTGEPPYCLFDFFDEFLLVIDESHIALPQLRGMYAGDRARKKNLIDFGFRLPSALDNRPLKFEEIQGQFKDVIFVSATPGDYELEHSGQIVEQLIRPTGVVDPKMEVHPREGQITHLIQTINQTKAADGRSLVMVLTKKLAEELARYLQEQKIKVCYMHHDIKTPQRTELLHKLRLGVFDVLVGVNLLREGLDLPEVAHVAIFDADVESFLRDKRSLIQIVGRAARNVKSRVILYADKITRSMRNAMDETDRRRSVQIAFNEEHNITPVSVKREVVKSISSLQKAIGEASAKNKRTKRFKNEKAMTGHLAQLERDMNEAAEVFDFEKAIALRDEWIELKKEYGKL